MILHTLTAAMTMTLLAEAAPESASKPVAERSAPAATAAPAEPSDWRAAEKGILENHVQLTSADRFVKAGESYFSPDDSRIIFQAVEKPRSGEKAEEFYGMFLADLGRNPAGAITGLKNIKRLSPPGSANTCGWFHPSDPNVVIFGSTIAKPTESTPPGFQRATGRYRWMFPPEMKIVQCNLAEADGTAGSLKVLVEMEKAYAAECSFSADGRHLIYCTLATGMGDLFVTDASTGDTVQLVSAAGYDGGPFFSPDGKRVCYRSDRKNDNLLQLFIGELKFNDQGAITGLTREFQITDNEHVNWCPYWHPSGKHLVYATSQMGHQNYEVFMVDADPGPPTRYGTRQRRITHAEGADVLPAFSSDGKTMMWTAQRDAEKTSQVWAADFVLNPQSPKTTADHDTGARPGAKETLDVKDPETGLIYLYDVKTHELTVYDPQTHTTRKVTDTTELAKAMKLFEQRPKKQ